MKEILLHVCCGPDATYSIERLKENGFERIVGYFLNDNIYPEGEYYKRYETYKTVFEHYQIGNVIAEYNPMRWLEHVKGYEKEPEKGKRCDLCYYYSLYYSALKAKELGIKLFTTTLSISPHKSSNRLFIAGQKAAQDVGEVAFLEENFKKKNGFFISIQRSKELGLYRQNYCGCVFSKVETEQKRKEKRKVTEV